jgi:ABC-type Mn2+/Zn2+ transport system ATPase subunit
MSRFYCRDNKSGAMDSTTFSIELGNANSKPFKSIDRVTWSDIPPFAVLTGLNGSGKTQFLQALAYKLVGATYQQQADLNAMPIQTSGVDIGPHEVAYLPSSESSFRVTSINISNIVNAKHAFLEQLKPQQTQHDINRQILREMVERKFGFKVSHQITPEQVAKLPDDYLFMLEYNDVSAGLGHVFYGYQVRRAELLMDGQTEEQVTKTLGPPPWQFVNDALAAAEFDYQIVPPNNKLLMNYVVRVKAIGSKYDVDLNDLSSGEKIILRTILWLYNTRVNNIFPKLFLLDEPDAYIHPSMTRQFIDALKGVLVDNYNVRVILTTHSPSTVALAPEESLFVMSREHPRIRRPTTKAEAIGMLTSGLVIVSPGTRFVIVEDEHDATFYCAIRDVLADQGPSRDPKSLRPAPSLVFMPASTGKGFRR